MTKVKLVCFLPLESKAKGGWRGGCSQCRIVWSEPVFGSTEITVQCTIDVFIAARALWGTWTFCGILVTVQP